MIGSTLFSASPIALIIPFVDIIVSGKQIPVPEGVTLPLPLDNLIRNINNMPVLRLYVSMVILIFIFFLFKGIFDFLRMYLMSDLSQRVIRDVKNQIYAKLQSLPIKFYSNKPTGELMSRITYDAAVIRDAISSGIADTFYQPIQLIVYAIMVIGCKLYFNIPWKLIMVSLILFPLVVYPVVRIGKKLRKISRDSQEKIGDINNLLLETITGIKLVKSFGMENYELNRFKEKNQGFYKLNMKSIKRMKIVSPLTEVMIVSCSVVIMLLVADNIVSGKMSIGAFGAFLAAIFSMQKPIKKLSNVYGINQQALAASERIFQLMDEEVTVKESKNPVILESFEKKIRFDDVFFSYDKDMIINGINLTVNKGEIVALVGPSGGGKSTLVNLIPRFYDPTKGRILIDGIDLQDIQIKSLRQKIGFVTQETLLFNDTVKNNICYGHDDADEEQLVKVAKAANAHQFIKEFPKGYDTEIGERGLKISGGQRQRIAIARAVYKNPPILIFDEATSQLDTESEKLVQEAINNLMKGRTVIVIAHRLSTIQHSDKIAVIENGRIAETGSHGELLVKSPLYKRLYEMQFADDNRETV
jgi:subfamily B ATP-binding cassette protein MsbA